MTRPARGAGFGDERSDREQIPHSRRNFGIRVKDNRLDGIGEFGGGSDLPIVQYEHQADISSSRIFLELLHRLVEIVGNVAFTLPAAKFGRLARGNGNFKWEGVLGNDLGQKNIDGGGHVQPQAIQNFIRFGLQLACRNDVNGGVQNAASYLVIMIYCHIERIM
jgi:hypothetical protein